MSILLKESADIAFDYTDPQWYLDLLHGGTKFQVLLGRKRWDDAKWPKYRWPYKKGWYQEFYGYGPSCRYELIEAIASLQHENGALQTYASMNTYRWKTMDGKRVIARTRDHLAELRALYADLDVYKVGLTQHEVLVKLECEYFDRLLPRPTFVSSSGQGIYLIWLLDKPCSPWEADHWQDINGRINEILKHLGADGKCATDLARVLRIPGTMNAANGQLARVMSYEDLRYSLQHFPFPDPPRLTVVPPMRHRPTPDASDRLPSERTDEPDERTWDAYEVECHRLQFVNRVKRDGVVYLRNEATRNQAILRDLDRLIAMRGDLTGCRELLLTLRRFYSCILGGPDSALVETMAANGRMIDPLPKREVINDTESADRMASEREEWLTEYGHEHEQKLKKAISIARQANSEAAWKAAIHLSKEANRRCWRFRNSTLIRWLDISETEMRSLEHIISRGEKARRNAEAHRRARRGPDNLTDAQRARQTKSARARELSAAGIAQTQIAQELSVSERTVRNWLHRDTSSSLISRESTLARAL